MQVPTPVQNPMWAFLQGIEGFDSTRAAECLVRLLDAHYDTIGVLKLATKDDLIKDVGLKPGDALRIVSAANGAVARCNVDRPKSHQPACESPELREKKRAKTVAQETWKSEGQYVVNQAAAPKEEISKQANEPTPTIPVAPKVHACGVCNVLYNSQTELHSHFFGTTHANFMDLATKSVNRRDTFTAGCTKSGTTGYLHCSLCDVTCLTIRQLVAHFNGNKHIKRLKIRT